MRVSCEEVELKLQFVNRIKMSAVDIEIAKNIQPALSEPAHCAVEQNERKEPNESNWLVRR